ncbi:uncharacterized protein UBRO_21018 [Ustilago bromivora]|uniref:Uncharacterized protein n=1 Tax=Ustilago bromivora TaxID=307758 RepID=A0A1K0GXV9_9BASI|nr:uncharacterized protein UBRO_21018 [Ustilago bromivora]
MVEETNPHASASDITKRSKRGRKVMTIQQTPVNTAANNDNDADEEYNSDLDDDDRRYDFHTLAKLLKLHLEGTYNENHLRWRHPFDDALTNAVRGTIDTVGDYNVNYLLLDIIREYLTFNQVWKKIKNGLGSKATRYSCWLALITQLGDIKMFHADTRKLIQEIRAIQAEGSILGRPFADNTLFSALQKCMI